MTDTMNFNTWYKFVLNIDNAGGHADFVTAHWDRCGATCVPV